MGGAGEIVDSHQHFLDIDRFFYRWMPSGPNVLRRNYLCEDLLPELASTGVSHTIVVEAHSSSQETAYLLELAARTPWIAGVVGWVDLGSRDVGRSLEALRRNPKLVGVRHQVESDPDEAWLVRPSTVEGLRALAAAGLAYDLVVYPKHLKYVPRVAEKVPTLRMALDHLGKPPIGDRALEPWASDAKEIARIPHLFCKISGMVTEAPGERVTFEDLKPYVDHVVEQFGPGRLMWGSDWPVCLKAASYARVMELARQAVASFTESQQKAFWGGTALQFYHVPAGADRIDHRGG